MAAGFLARWLGRRGPSVPPAAPGADAAECLEGRLRRQRAAQRARLRTDLARVGHLLAAGEEEQAAAVLSEYEHVLRAYAARLEDVLAEAVVVREAERVAPRGQPRPGR